MNRYLLLCAVILAVVFSPIFAQTESPNIVINEVDLNPQGNDALSATEWIELYNPTNSTVDLTNWEIASTTLAKKTLVIPGGTILSPDSVLIFSYLPSWFTDAFESVELRDPAGVVVDKTPLLTDNNNDEFTWQRIYDGFDTDAQSDWKFASHTINQPNGKLVESSEDVPLTISISSDPSYEFGQTAVISGMVSKEIIVQKPIFYSEPILITIIGPNYQETRTLYPRPDLTYTTSLSLNPAHGLVAGNYTASAAYAGLVTSTSFLVSAVTSSAQIVSDSIKISTDKDQYMPGETVSISGTTNKSAIYKGISFTISDPDDSILNEGIVFPRDGGDFSTEIYLPRTITTFGVYTIDINYDNLQTTATFVVDIIPQSTESISEYQLVVDTNQDSYNYGDIMTISGSLVRSDGSKIQSGSTIDITITDSDNLLVQYDKLSDILSPSIDVYGTYRTQLDISGNHFSDGAYTVQAKYKDTNSTTTFTVIKNPITSKEIQLSLDKDVYALGELLTLTGMLPSSASPSVSILVTYPDGSTTDHSALLDNNQFVWSWNTPSHIVNTGIYTITASTNSYFKTIQFKVSTDTQTDSFSQEPLTILVPKERYNIGETLVITGHVLVKDNNNQNFKIPNPVHVSVISAAYKGINESFVLPNVQGAYTTSFDLSRHVSDPGLYTVQAKHLTHTATDTFVVFGDPAAYDDLSVDISIDKTDYNPGDTLKLVAKPNTLVDLQQLNITLVQTTQDTMCDPNCADLIRSLSTISQNMRGAISHELQIPNSTSSIGTYQVIIDSKYTSDTTTFSVIPQPPDMTATSIPTTFIERFEGITDSARVIDISVKDINGTSFISRALTAILSTNNTDVNFVVSTSSGICIIGQTSNCLVSELTQRPGQIYQIVGIKDSQFSVRYSGPDVASERFTIIPTPLSGSVLDGQWTIGTDSEDIPSTFDYKITYRAKK